jgi:hypothetical protein
MRRGHETLTSRRWATRMAAGVAVAWLFAGVAADAQMSSKRALPDDAALPSVPREDLERERDEVVARLKRGQAALRDLAREKERLERQWRDYERAVKEHEARVARWQEDKQACARNKTWTRCYDLEDRRKSLLHHDHELEEQGRDYEAQTARYNQQIRAQNAELDALGERERRNNQRIEEYNRQLAARRQAEQSAPAPFTNQGPDRPGSPDRPRIADTVASGRWVQLDVQVTAWGSDRLASEGLVSAGIVNGQGEASFVGNYLQITNNNRRPIFFTSVAAGEVEREIAPGATRTYFMAIYRSRTDDRPHEADLTVRFWKEGR